MQFGANVDIKRCRQSIDFSVLSPQNILWISEVEICRGDLYEQAREPARNGPLDLRLGVGAKCFTCDTCGKTLENCFGHFGHTQLSLPIYHVGYFKHVIVVLKMVCKHCFRVLLPEPTLAEYTRKMTRLQSNYIARLAFFKRVFKEASHNLICPHCLKRNPKIQKLAKICGKIEVRDSALAGMIEEQKIRRGQTIVRKKQDISYQLNPIEALKILQGIPKDEIVLVNVGGSTAISDLIITHLVVPPVNIRPSVMLTNSLSNEDDLTIKLKEIIELNKKMLTSESVQRMARMWYLLQSHWSQYINSDASGLPLLDLKQKYIRSFCTRLKGKQGRFRQNLSGKRSNYTARTVISPDPNLRLNQVAIPTFMSQILTVKDCVNRHNIAFLNNSLKNKKINFVYSRQGQKMMAHSFKGRLRIGDSVERHLMDGDIVIFNRQPSLHRLSMMGFEAKICSGKTLCFNECVCAPFNADFDGDEMNIHVPQTLEACSQTKHLMGVNNNIMTPKSGEPIIALMQDFLTTAYLLTSKDLFLTQQQFTRAMIYFLDGRERMSMPTPAILKPVQLWTGKQLVNCAINPVGRKPIVNLRTRQKAYTSRQCMCLQDGWVQFKNGELVCGQIGKIVLGGGSKSGLLYALLRDSSMQAACDFMHRFSRLSARWLTDYGMTIGLSDVTPALPLLIANNHHIKEAYSVYHQYLAKFERGILDAKPGMSVEETLQSLLNTTLSKVRETVGNNCIAQLGRHNKPLIMALCGSKGNAVNLSQMMGCVGQQTVGGKRITYGFTERALPHFGRLVLTPEARGFVKNSFCSGLTATQFFFHTMGGREGIIDTAVKTADTGYMQRRLIKLIEDVAVMYDYTVRTCDRKEIIQFRYGDDGLDPIRTEESKEPVNMTNLQDFVKCLPQLHPAKFLSPQDIISLCQLHIQRIKNNIFGLSESFLSTLFDRLRKYFQDKSKKLTEEWQQIGLQANKQYLRNSFSGITQEQMRCFFDNYVKRINRGVLQPGQAVGALAAQSIGQPATQMTLKTFHFAGISSMSITQGVPRVNEIINNTRNIATPIITIYLLPSMSSKDHAIAIKHQVQKMPLSKILHSIEEIYDVKECSLNIVLSSRVMHHLNIHLPIETVNAHIVSALKSRIKRIEIKSNTVLNIIPNTKTNLAFELKSLRRRVLGVMVGGIETISRTLIVEREGYVLFAQGTGLKRVLGLAGVDTIKSSSNHIAEIEECLGVEAARQAIINQITETMREHGVSVNSRHINLLAEVMTCKGQVIGFTRNGVDKMKDSTIMLASFEKTTDFLFDAATQGKHDRMKGVSEKIIMGQPITLGTGMFDIKQTLAKKKIY